MSNPRDAFGAALAALRRDLRDGALRPGRPLLVVDLAQRLRISPTPVREALSRLTGEGLVQEERGRGFHARRLDAADLAELYQLHGALVDTGITCWMTNPPTASACYGKIDDGAILTATQPPENALRALTERLWTAVVSHAENRSLTTFHGLIADQLALARLVEPRIIPDLVTEIDGLRRLSNGADLAALLQGARMYHERRAAMAWSLASAIRETYDQ